MVSQKLQELFTMLRHCAEEMLDEIMATAADVEEEEQILREGIDLISNICSINEEETRALIVADTAARAATARKPQTPEADKIISGVLGSRAAEAPEGSPVGSNLSLVDVVLDWAETNSKYHNP